MENWVFMGGAMLLISIVYPPFFGFVLGAIAVGVITVFFSKLLGG